MTPFVAAMQEAAQSVLDTAETVQGLKELIGTLEGKTIEINVETRGLGEIGKAGAGAAGAGVSGLGPQFDALRQDIAGVNDELQMQTELLNQMAVAMEGVRRDTVDASTELMTQTLLMRDMGAAAGRTADGVGRLGPALLAAGAGAGGAAGGLMLFGMAAGTVVHWAVAAGAEFLAVAIPAAVALGAAMVVAAQGAQMVYQHMSALYTATEATANMFHTTIGSALGLHSALQQAQNAANPIVWSVLGGALTIVKSNFQGLASVGLDVMRIFQTFTARVVADFQSGLGGTVHGLLSSMVTDLTEFAQILGNVGHALLNFAAAMPGLAEVLLRLVDGASQVVLWFSRLPPVLIGVAMGMEEFWRWGGALAGILRTIPTALGLLVSSGFGLIPVFARLGEVFKAAAMLLPTLAANLGHVASTALSFIPGMAEAGAAVEGFATDVNLAVASMGPLEAALTAAAVGGVAFLIVLAARARTSLQQLGDSMQATVDKAQGMQVFTDIAGNLAKLNAMQAQYVGYAQRASQAAGGQVMEFGKASVAIGGAASMMQEFSGPISQQSADLMNATEAVRYISSAYGTSFVGALTLATQAGVQLDQGIGTMNKNAALNLIKVGNLVAGYRAMGQTAGAVGADMTAIAIQAGLQSSKVQQLTQAWQAYMGLLTGGTNSLATFEQGLQNIGTVSASTAGTLFEATGQMNQSTRNFATSLQGFTGKSAQNWQNFNQVVTTGAEGFINWMQTAGAVGAVSGNQMTGAIKNIIGQLLPFAAHSQAARAELAGLAAQTGAVVPPTMKALEAWAKGGMSARQPAKFVQEATARLSDMSSVAAHLGNVMQSDLVAMFDKAKIAESGLPGALNALVNALSHASTPTGVLDTRILGVAQRLLNLHQSLPAISAMLLNLGVNVSAAGLRALIASGQLHAAGDAAAGARGQMDGATVAAHNLGAALSQLHSINLTVTTSYINEGAPGLGGTGFKFVPGHAAGGPVTSTGWQMVGEQGPEIRWLNAGDYISNAADTRHYFAAGGGAPAYSHGGGGFTGTVNLTHTTHVQANVDQGVLFEAMKTETAKYSYRNGNQQQGRLAPGAL